MANSGVQNDVAFVTADLSLWTVAFNLYDMMKVPLCDASLVSNANNQYTCPGTGAYNYEFSYKLPDAGSQATSWMASGWQSSGTVQLYAAQDKTMKIGDCTMALKTYVTQSSQKSSLLSTPSAAATAGIVLASLVVLGLLFLYCYCCCARKRKQNSKIATTENASHFKQLEDEKTYWSGAGSKLSKKTITTKKSGGTGEGSQSVVSELLP